MGVSRLFDQKDHRRHDFRVFFSNVTVMGPQAKTFIEQLDMQVYKVAMFVETHVPSSETDKWSSTLRALGWRLSANPAVPKNAGFSGGEWILTQMHLASSDARLWAQARAAVSPARGAHREPFFAATALHLRAHTLVIVSAYFLASVGAIGNGTRIRELAIFLSHLRTPWCVAADWNMEPAELAGTPLVSLCGGLFLLPQGVESTCSTPNRESMYDYLLLSEEAVALVDDLQPDTKVPWKTHIGLSFRVGSGLANLQERVLRLPRPLPRPPAPPKAPDPDSKTQRAKKAAELQRVANFRPPRDVELARARLQARRLLLRQKAQERRDARAAASSSNAPAAIPVQLNSLDDGEFVDFDSEWLYQQLDLEDPFDVPPGAETRVQGPRAFMVSPQVAGSSATPAVNEGAALPGEGGGCQETEALPRVKGPLAIPLATWQASVAAVSEHTTLAEVPDFVRQSVAYKESFARAGPVSLLYQLWVSSMEHAALDTAQVLEGERRPYVGRAQLPDFTLRPKRLRRIERVVTGDYASDWWAKVSSLLTVYIRLRRQLKDARQQRCREVSFKECAADAPKREEDYPKHLSPQDKELWVFRLRDMAAVHVDVLQGMLEVAEKQHSRCVTRAARRASKRFDEWMIETFDKKPGLVHRTVKERQRIEQELAVPDGCTADPVLIMKEKASSWEQIWQDPSYDPQDISDMFSALHQAADFEPLPDLELGDVDRALSTMPAGTGHGIDTFGPRDVARLPLQARTMFLHLLRMVEYYRAWPLQTLVVIAACIPKKLAGDRVIGLMAMLSRIWSKSRDSFMGTFNFESAPFWDTAIKGSSPLRAAMRRLLLDELAAVEGLESITNMVDLQKFYDSIPHAPLVRAALKRGFPALVLLLEALQFSAVRFFRKGEAVSLGVLAQRSVVAGSRRGHLFARCILYEILHQAHFAFRRSPVDSFIDDLAQRTEGARRTVAPLAVQAGAFLFEMLTAAGFAISDKSVIVGTYMATAQEVASSLSRQGWPVKAALVGADLGIDAAGGKRHRRAQRSKRASTAAKRFQKIIRFAKGRKLRVARRLALTGAFPQATYGHQVHGTPPSRVLQLRRALAKSAVGKRYGRCLTTTLAATIGTSDPALRLVKEQFSEWFALWFSSPALRARIRRDWPIILQRLEAKPSRSRWSCIPGPVHALIAALLDLRVKPVSPERWELPGGEVWCFEEALLDGNFDYSTLVEDLVALADRLLWSRAQFHEHGAGLAPGGPDLVQVRRQVRRMEAKGQWAERGMMLAVVSGGLWPQSRLHEMAPEVSVECPRCGMPESLFHRCWECEANVDHDIYAKTSVWRGRAARGVEAVPCLWLRGIAPKSWTHAPPPREQQWAFGEWEAVERIASSSSFPLDVFGDASGGANSSDPRIRRVGLGIVTLRWRHDRWEPATSVFGSLVGRQSVPRGETFAFLWALQRTAGPINYITDNEGLMLNWQRGRAFHPAGSNADLWWMIKRAIETRPGGSVGVTVIFINSHPEPRDLERDDAPLYLFAGNAMADAVAGEAAKRLEKEVSVFPESVDAMAAAVRMRMAQASRDVLDIVGAVQEPSREQKASQRAARRKQLEVAKSETEHTLQLYCGRYRCTRCKQSAGGRSLLALLRSPCDTFIGVGRRSVPVDPVAMGVHRPRVGGALLHESHRLAWHDVQGVWFCQACGFYAALRADRLREPCAVADGRPATRAGLAYLRRLEMGLWPTTRRPVGMAPAGRI